MAEVRLVPIGYFSYVLAKSNTGLIWKLSIGLSDGLVSSNIVDNWCDNL